MANEKKTTKVQVCVLLEWEDFIKAQRVFGVEGESRSELIQHLIHDLVKDVKLTAEELRRLDEIYKDQYERRMKLRNEKKERGR